MKFVRGVSLIFVLAGALLTTRVPPDFTIAASILGLVLLVRLTAAPKLRFLPLRLLAYVAILFVVYL